MALFEKYKEYLLGDYCYGLRSSEDSGSLVPPWNLVLIYEHAIRKHAYKVMATAGYTFGAELVHAYKEPSVKERHFTAPLALHAKRPQPWDASAERPPKKLKGKGRGKGKEGKAKKLKEGSDRNSEGLPICFRYNAKGRNKGDKCHFAHVCMLCFGKHPATRCPHRRRYWGPSRSRTLLQPRRPQPTPGARYRFSTSSRAQPGSVPATWTGSALRSLLLCCYRRRAPAFCGLPGRTFVDPGRSAAMSTPAAWRR